MQKFEGPKLGSQLLRTQGQLLLSSFYRVTGKPLIEGVLPNDSGACELYGAPFAVVSHGVEADPIFNYGNRAAQALFEMDCAALTRLPSRYSAEPKVRAEREGLLARVNRNGFIADYTGVRISSSGKRFFVDSAIVWNVIESDGSYCGQAAALFSWSELSS